MELLISMDPPIKIKKAYNIDLVYTQGTQNYDSQIGINIYSLPINKYTLIMEYYYPENIGISVSCQASTAIIAKQISNNFQDYIKLLVQFDQRTKDTPDYLYFNIRGSGTTSTNPEGYLIFYDAKKWFDVVNPSLYDHSLVASMFVYDDGNMKMNTDLDMNNHKITNLKEGINDTDAVNKLQLDSVSYYTNNHTYREIFHENFYDLIETSTFNINKNSFGVVILGVKPNLHLGSNRFLSNYDRIHGLQLSNGHILLKNNVKQSTSFTLFLSIHFSNDIVIKFARDLVTKNGYYPFYSVTQSNNRMSIHESKYI